MLSVLLVFSFVICGQPKKFLVIGGDDILGCELVSLLVRQDADVSVLDFYSWVYDESKHRHHPSATHIQCERFMINTCKDFTDLLAEKGRFDIVYDTSTVKPNHLKVNLAKTRKKKSTGRNVCS